MRDFFDTEVSRAALARLERGLRQSRGLLVLVGEVGSGKTMVVRRLLENLEEEIFDASMLVVLSGAADSNWMLTRFARQLGIEEPEEEREALLAQVYDHLAIIREDGRHAVLIIDDADVLASRETLAEVCGLLKLEYEERRLFSLVLCGGPGLEEAIAADKTLAHRVEVKVHMTRMDLQMTTRYLGTRVRQSGGVPAILDEAAVLALHELGFGLPGRMNALADNALFEAFLCGRERVSREDVIRAHGDLGWDANAPIGTLGREVGTVDGAELEVLEAGTGDLEADLDAVFSTTGSQDPVEITAAGQTGGGAPPKDEDDLFVELLDE
jgi:type II secretory pathway predicted ATPase ExeA